MGMQKRSTLDACLETLVILGEEDRSFMAVEGGAGCSSLLGGFASAFPDRCIRTNTGEQDMILTAAGLAVEGMHVFVSASASFLVGRGYEQIRSAVAIPGLPVKMAGTHCGITVGEDGASLQMLEDLAIMRAFPNMSVFVPADFASAGGILRAAAALRSPAYVRVGEMPVPDVYAEGDRGFTPGGGRVLREGAGVTVCCCGIMVAEALKAAEVLARQDISAEVIDCYSVSPLPSQIILDSVHRTGCCVTAEEHFVRGGLGEAVSGLTGTSYPVPVKQVAVFDKFGQSGSPQELQEYYGLTASQIVSAAMQAWIMRRR